MSTSVTYELHEGGQRQLDVPDGTSVMQAAVSNGVPGIVAECGGQLMCATCHVYVEEAVGEVPEQSADEIEMLELAAAETTAQSRLSCQLVCGPQLDALVVRIPEKQV